MFATYLEPVLFLNAHIAPYIDCLIGFACDFMCMLCRIDYSCSIPFTQWQFFNVTIWRRSKQKWLINRNGPKLFIQITYPKLVSFVRTNSNKYVMDSLHYIHVDLLYPNKQCCVIQLLAFWYAITNFYVRKKSEINSFFCRLLIGVIFL